MESAQESKTPGESGSDLDWPVCERKTHTRSQTSRGGMREDRMLQEITVAIPPFIAEQPVSVVAATQTLKRMIDDVGRTKRIEIETITSSHAILMTDAGKEREYAGRFRDMQNWIGGSDYSPRGALYISPPPESVLDSMNDLVVFSNRNDIPA